MNSAVDIMRDRQKREHLTDEQFTDLLGVHRSTWAKVKGGQRKPGLKLLRSFDQQFPHVDIFSKYISATTPEASPDGSTGGLRRWLRYLVLRIRHPRQSRVAETLKSKSSGG